MSSPFYRNQPPSLLVQSPHIHVRVLFLHNAVSVRLILLSIACVAYLQRGSVTGHKLPYGELAQAPGP